MQTDQENLTAQQSLDIITAMIRQAKGNVSSNSFHFLLWGATIMIANLGVYFTLLYTNDILLATKFFGLTIVSAVISVVYGAMKSRKQSVKTILDIANTWVWVAYACLCFTIAFFGSKINYQINPILIGMAAIPTLISGIILRFKPLMFGGVALWIFGIILFLFPGPIQFLISAIAVAVGYLIPGIMLKKSNG